MRQIDCGSSAVRLLAYAPDSTRLWSAVGDFQYFRRILLWEVATGDLALAIDITPYTSAVAVAPNANAYFAAAPGQASIRYPMSPEIDDLNMDVFSMDIPSVIALSDAGTFAALAGPSQHLQYGFDIEVIALERPFDPTGFHSLLSLRGMAFSPDDRFLACAGTGGFTLWDRVHRESIGVDSYPLGGQVVYSPTGALIATTSADEVMLREGFTGRVQRIIHPLPTHPATAIAFSADSHLLATANANLVHFWNLNDGRLLTKFDWNIGTIHSLALSPDGLTAAAGGSGKIVIWDLE